MAAKGSVLTQRRRDAEVAEKVRLSDVFELQMGKTPARDNKAYWGGTNDWVAISDINDSDEYISSTKKAISDIAVRETNIKAVPCNTLIMSFKLTIGRVAITRHRIYTNEAIMAFIDKGQRNFDLHYLYHQFKNKDWTAGSNRAVMGTTLNKASLSCATIFFPPLAEQKRIAAVLDKICELKKNAEAQIENLDLLVKSRFVEKFGDPKTNPKGWPIGRVSDLAKYWNGLTYKPENVSDRGIIVLRSSNIQGGCLDFADTVRVNISAKEKNVVEPGDILMCSRNGSAALVGKTAIIPETEERMYFGAFMMILRSEVPEYLNTYFATKAFRSQITCGATSTVNQITCSMMDDVKLPIPPKDLMSEFAAFVEKVEKLKDVAKKIVEEMDTLYRAKLQEYFG